MNFKELVNRISGIYDEREASSIVKMLLEESFGLSFVDVCLGALDRLSDDDKESLEGMMLLKLTKCLGIKEKLY